MIPRNIARAHVIKAIEEIHQRGIPSGRLSRDFFLLFEGQSFPPKYVISVANRYANGVELDPSVFNGGKESNTFLTNLDFEISGNTIRPAKLPVAKPDRDAQPRYAAAGQPHNERCPQCKATVKAMLERIYGEVRPGYSLPLGASLEDYANSSLYSALKEIYSALQTFRGNREFVRANALPPVDYFIPNPGFVVEFDESQHFTACRKLALSLYPGELPVKFRVDRWTQLCSEINAEDNTPKYRDEQRAWYDTLRDFAPTIRGLKPTVRLYSEDFQWCSLHPENADDRAWFEKVLMNGMPKWEINPEYDPKPWVARIIIDGAWSKKAEDAARLLNEVCDIWEDNSELKNTRTPFLMTCGGFLEFKWPGQVTKDAIKDSWNPSVDALTDLFRAAEQTLRNVLTKDLLQRLAKYTDYFSVGVDSSKQLISTTKNYINQPHVELVSLVNTKTGAFAWTGKSYPTTAQQGGLLRITDLETHFIKLTDIGMVMVLGCHDLNIFNNRNFEHTGLLRKTIKKDFRELAKRKQPMVILHHPHTTPSPRTWASAWGTIRTDLPFVKRYASSGSYYDDRKELPSLTDTKVLSSTKQGASIDFIVYTYHI